MSLISELDIETITIFDSSITVISKSVHDVNVCMIHLDFDAPALFEHGIIDVTVKHVHQI